MDNYEDIDHDYLKGFNEGYLLAQHMPELAEQLSRSKSESQRFTGLQDGRREFMMEKIRSLRPSRLQHKESYDNDPQPNKDQDRDFERDIDR